MWLFRAWHKCVGLPVDKTGLLHPYMSRCHNSCSTRSVSSYPPCSSIIPQIKKSPLLGKQSWLRYRSTILERSILKRKLQCLPFTGIQRMHIYSFSTRVERNLRIPDIKDHRIQKIPSHRIHSSVCCRDIPDYLQGNISEVASLEDHLLSEEFEDELDNDMEEEIIDFLNSRLLSYEETESSFMLPCHSCSSDDQTSRAQEIFVDKNSGYFVCPWCCQSGTWEELRHLIDRREDVITTHQLSTYLSTASQISEVNLDVLEESPLQAVSLTTLEECGAKVTNDGTRLVLPLKLDCGSIVGFESVSLLHPVPQIVRRYVAGETKPLFIVDTLKDLQRIVVVPTCCDVLTLAEYKIPAVSIPPNDMNTLCDYLTTACIKEVYLWLGISSPPRQLVQTLVSSEIPSWIIRCEQKDSPVHAKSLKEVQAALNNIIPVLSDATTTFSELKDKIYHRLTNKEETCGVQWKRFSELNAILLGHRLGEMTVLTGPTGSGKTTLMAEYSLDLCSQGVVTLWGSFEISVVRLCEVMLQQYSGKPLPIDHSDFNALASKFSNLPLHFLTYHGQQTTKSVLEAMTEAVQIWGVQHVVIDNLQFMLGTSERAVDRWWEQDKAVAAFRRFATANNCHISLIVHPKKVPEGQLLGVESIFGGAKVTQEADNVLILQVKDSNTINQSKKALQVVKNRYGGQLGVLPLKFHRESLTLSSHFSHKSKADKEKSSQTSRKGVSAKQVKGLKAFMN